MRIKLNRLSAALLFGYTSTALLAQPSPSESHPPEATDQYYGENFEALMRLDHDMQKVVRFIHVEQGRLAATRKLLRELQDERHRLQIVAAADQSVVDALFSEQGRRASVAVWRERGIGFASGVVASVIAAFISNWLRQRFSRAPRSDA